ncbi:MAG TPA: methionyl-tRNA formyltransferase [Polyangiales bacterium]|nr:methionyl-tRNA formyltransferase [Polyangiales bacterium]
MRAAFLGTPDFAVPCLEALLEVAEVPLVITQPDKPSGRGMALQPPPVKAFALERGLRVEQPSKARDGALLKLLQDEALDFALVVAYGKILPKDVLEAPRLGCLNVHGSLLPRWRGAAPIQWAVVSGDAQTGVCLMQMDVGMDTGPVLARRVVDIGAHETGGELFERLSRLSGDLVREELPRLQALVPVEQPSEGVTHARMIEKGDGQLDFTQPAQAVHDRARGFYPWPGAFANLGERRVKIHRTRVALTTGPRGAPGSVLQADADGIVVACGEGAVRIEELQLEGKKRVSAQAFLAGHPLAAGASFT